MREAIHILIHARGDSHRQGNDVGRCQRGHDPLLSKTRTHYEYESQPGRVSLVRPRTDSRTQICAACPELGFSLTEVKELLAFRAKASRLVTTCDPCSSTSWRVLSGR